MITNKKYAAVIIIGLFLSILAGCTPGKSQLKQNGYDNERINYGANDDTMTNENNRQGNNPNVRSGIKQQEREGYTNRNRVSSGSGYDQRDGYNEKNTGRLDNESRNERNTADDKSFTFDNGDGRSQENTDRNGTENISRDVSSGKDGFFQTGMASWYGREFHGKVTASGERFNMNRFTAAHKTLPFGTIVEVKNLDNGKTTTVEINDRGPYKGNRIIDLSYSAAKNLSMLSSGMANVGIRIVKKGDKYANDDAYSDRRSGDNGKKDLEPVVGNENDDDRGSRSSTGAYSIQAGAFYSKKKAENLKRKIEGLTRNSVTVINDGDLYKVRIDGIESKKEAKRFKGVLREEKIEGYIINKE